MTDRLRPQAEALVKRLLDRTEGLETEERRFVWDMATRLERKKWRWTPALVGTLREQAERAGA